MTLEAKLLMFCVPSNRSAMVKATQLKQFMAFLQCHHYECVTTFNTTFVMHSSQSTFPTVNAYGKNTCQITGIRTNTKSTHYIMYKVASLEWSKSAQWGTCKSDSRKPERLFVKAECITVKFHCFLLGKKAP